MVDVVQLASSGPCVEVEDEQGLVEPAAAVAGADFGDVTATAVRCGENMDDEFPLAVFHGVQYDTSGFIPTAGRGCFLPFAGRSGCRHSGRKCTVI